MHIRQLSGSFALVSVSGLHIECRLDPNHQEVLCNLTVGRIWNPRKPNETYTMDESILLGIRRQVFARMIEQRRKMHLPEHGPVVCPVTGQLGFRI